MLSEDDDIKRRRRFAVIQAEMMKTTVVGQHTDLDAEERLIITSVLLERLKNPAKGPSYATLARRMNDLISERTVARRCNSLIQRGVLRRPPSGLLVADAEAFYRLADEVYDLYMEMVCKTESRIRGGGCKLESLGSPDETAGSLSDIDRQGPSNAAE